MLFRRATHTLTGKHISSRQICVDLRAVETGLACSLPHADGLDREAGALFHFVPSDCGMSLDDLLVELTDYERQFSNGGPVLTVPILLRSLAASIEMGYVEVYNQTT